MDELLDKAVQEVANSHRKIIDDWCKAYCAQLYQENGDIKPGDSILVEQIDLVLENGKMGKKYWFEPK